MLLACGVHRQACKISGGQRAPWQRKGCCHETLRPVETELISKGRCTLQEIVVWTWRIDNRCFGNARTAPRDHGLNAHVAWCSRPPERLYKRPSREGDKRRGKGSLRQLPKPETRPVPGLRSRRSTSRQYQGSFELASGHKELQRDEVPEEKNTMLCRETGRYMPRTTGSWLMAVVKMSARNIFGDCMPTDEQIAKLPGDHIREVKQEANRLATTGCCCCCYLAVSSPLSFPLSHYRHRHPTFALWFIVALSLQFKSAKRKMSLERFAV